VVKIILLLAMIITTIRDLVFGLSIIYMSAFLDVFPPDSVILTF